MDTERKNLNNYVIEDNIQVSPFSIFHSDILHMSIFRSSIFRRQVVDLSSKNLIIIIVDI